MCWVWTSTEILGSVLRKLECLCCRCIRSLILTPSFVSWRFLYLCVGCSWWTPESGAWLYLCGCMMNWCFLWTVGKTAASDGCLQITMHLLGRLLDAPCFIWILFWLLHEIQFKIYLKTFLNKMKTFFLKPSSRVGHFLLIPFALVPRPSPFSFLSLLPTRLSVLRQGPWD